jgi:hypothetical protein
LESTFSGLDFGDGKGMHMSTAMLESVGRDLCRALLIEKSIFVPPELSKIFKGKEFGEDAESLN